MRIQPKPAPKAPPKAAPKPPPLPAPTPTKPKISRDAAKLRMAYVMADFLGIGVSSHSSAVYEALNAAGWYWFPSRMAWGQLGASTSSATGDAGSVVAESDGAR